MAFCEITLSQRFKIKVFGLTPMIRTRSHRSNDMKKLKLIFCGPLTKEIILKCILNNIDSVMGKTDATELN